MRPPSLDGWPFKDLANDKELRYGSPRLPESIERPQFYVRVAWIARQTFSGLVGMSMHVTPSGRSASATAFMTAGRAPTVPASPAPFTPSGFVRQGTS